MTFVSPHLISAHAPLISAPHPTRHQGAAAAAVAAEVPGHSAAHLAALARRRRDGTDGAEVQPERRPMISVGIEKNGLGVGDRRLNTREIARIAPGGGMGVGRSSGGDATDYKVTGTSIFDRPDKDSRWDPGNGGRWIRKWQPGEKEAEALGRVGEVRNRQDMTRAEHSAWLQSLLKPKIGTTGTSGVPAIRTGFASAITGANPSAAAAPSGSKEETPAPTDTPTPSAAEQPGSRLQEQIRDAMSAIANFPEAQTEQPKSWRDETLATLFQSLTGKPYEGGTPTDASATNDDIGSVYANGGTVFGMQDAGSGDGPLAWMRPSGEDVDTAISDEYMNGMGGLIGALTMRG